MPTRYLKPGICDSDSIDKCSPLAENLFYRLLVNVDDYGRLDARSVVIKSRCFPLKEGMNSAHIEPLLSELSRNGLIHLYTTVNGCRYLQFLKWDNVPRSKISKFPVFDDTCTQMYADVCNGNTNLPVTVTVTVTETKTETDIHKHKPPAEYSAEFELAWLAYPSRPGASKKDSYRTWNARLKAGVESTAIIAGVVRYANYCKTQRTEPQYIKQPSSFFGTGEHYLADWSCATPSNARTPAPDNFESINYGKGVQDL
jgi:hypothetical protein